MAAKERKEGHRKCKVQNANLVGSKCRRDKYRSRVDTLACCFISSPRFLVSWFLIESPFLIVKRLAEFSVPRARSQLPDSFAHAEQFGVVELGVGPFGEAAFGLFHFEFQFFDGRLVTCGELGRLVARKAVRHQFVALSGVSAAPFLDIVGKAAQGRSDFVGRSEFREFG